VVFHDQGIEAVEAVHGHDGRTRIVWQNSDAERLGFLVDYLYEALGPANDDIMDMAEKAWEERKQ
jgi:hypothetical protein